MENERLPLRHIILIGFLPSFLKKLIYRLKGYHIARQVRFSLGSIIVARDQCQIGAGSHFGFLSVIQARSVKIGRCCRIRSMTLIKANKIVLGDDVIISETAIIRASHLSSCSTFTAGDRVHVFPRTILDPSCSLALGEETGVGFYTSIYTHGSYKNALDGYRFQYAPVSIGKRVELAYNVFVAPGTTIGDDAIVGYGSYVNSNIPAGVLAAGLPAKVRRIRDELAPPLAATEKLSLVADIIRNFCEHMHYSAGFDVTNCSDTVWSLKKKKRGFQVVLLIDQGIPADAKRDNVYILFSRHSQYAFKPTSGCQAFDILCLKCTSKLRRTGLEMREYFERYGIRFQTCYLSDGLD